MISVSVSLIFFFINWYNHIILRTYYGHDFFHATILTSIFSGTPTLVCFWNLFLKTKNGEHGIIYTPLLCFNFMTFVENIFNSYQGGSYPPSPTMVHITSNSPTWHIVLFYAKPLMAKIRIFFLFGFYGPSRLFHSFWSESIVRWGENGKSPRKIHLATHKQNLACLTCDLSYGRLEPTAVRWRAI